MDWDLIRSALERYIRAWYFIQKGRPIASDMTIRLFNEAHFEPHVSNPMILSMLQAIAQGMVQIYGDGEVTIHIRWTSDRPDYGAFMITFYGKTMFCAFVGSAAEMDAA